MSKILGYHVGQGFHHFLGGSDSARTRTSVWDRRRVFTTLIEAENHATQCNQLFPRIPKWEARTAVECK